MSSAVAKRRRAILRAVFRATKPVTVSWIARRVTMTPRAIRSHLSFLAARGLVMQDTPHFWRRGEGVILRRVHVDSLA